MEGHRPRCPHSIAINQNLFNKKIVPSNDTKNENPRRKRPAHHPPITRFNCSILIFVTICTQSRRASLANPTALEAFRKTFAKTDRWIVGKFMLMPDHVHFFCSPAQDPPMPLKNWISHWKRIFTMNIRKTNSLFMWQRDFWDTQMRSGESYSAKWNYVRENPVRAGLVSEPNDWLYQGELSQLSFS
ncbi:MAG: transposase [Verrucomicrobiota bacterium]